MKVYLADLDYFTKGNRIETPLGIGFVAAYCKPLFPEVEFKLFKDPDILIKALRESPPDILGLSCFVWNMKLNEKLIAIARDAGDVYVVAGGPNSRLCKADCIVIGQGEKAFASILAGNRRDYIEGEFIDPPSPYLDGTLDDFMDLLPIVETARGCPYRCGYCSGGTPKINIRDEETVKREIDYLAERSHKAIDLSDTNFGMCGERDLRIINYIRDKGLYLAGFATSRKKGAVSIEVVKTISDIIGELYLGLQTLTKKALRASNRSNISDENLKKLVGEAKVIGRPVCVDLIFGLPYETLDSFIKTLSTLFEMGISSPIIYQLRLLPFTDFWYNRDNYGFKTKFRPFNNRYGTIGGTKIVEAEEIVVESNWLNLDDYLAIREIGLFITLMSEYGVFREAFSANPIHLIETIRKEHKPHLAAWLEGYREYARKELFDTPEEVYACNPEDFFKLNLGFAGYAIFRDRDILKDIGQIINAEPKAAPKVENTYSELPTYQACERILLYSPRNIW